MIVKRLDSERIQCSREISYSSTTTNSVEQRGRDDAGAQTQSLERCNQEAVYLIDGERFCADCTVQLLRYENMRLILQSEGLKVQIKKLQEVQEKWHAPPTLAGPEAGKAKHFQDVEVYGYGPAAESGHTDVDTQAEEFAAEIQADENREIVEQIQAEEESDHLADTVVGKPRL
jgi:hypothetical protein